MKRKFIVLTALLVTVVTLTGCGNTKTLTCTNDTNATREAKIVYSKDEVKKMTIKQFLGEGSTKEEVEEAKKTYEEQLEKNKKDGMTVKVIVEDMKLFLSMEVEIDKLDEETKKSYLESVAGADQSYDATKKSLEDEGYICK